MAKVPRLLTESRATLYSPRLLPWQQALLHKELRRPSGFPRMGEMGEETPDGLARYRRPLKKLACGDE